MPRPKGVDRVTSLERQHAELAAQLKSAKAAAAKRKREADDRRALLLGAAVLAQLSAAEFGDLVRRVIPAHVKPGNDRSLFSAWLPPELLASEAKPQRERKAKPDAAGKSEGGTTAPA